MTMTYCVIHILSVLISPFREQSKSSNIKSQPGLTELYSIIDVVIFSTHPLLTQNSHKYTA